MPPPVRLPDKEKMAFVIDNYAKYRRDEIIRKEYIRCVAYTYSARTDNDLKLSAYTVILCVVKVAMLPLPCTTKQSTENIITNFEFKENTGFLEEPSNYCHLNLSIEDTIKAKEKFEEEMLKDENIFAFYIYLSKPPALTTNKLDEYIANEEARNKWNGLQEWFWVKQDMKYYTLNLPIDLDALTFRISKYGTQNIDIRWTLGTNCHKDNKISYKNETQIILNYIWTNIIGNKSKSYICHRNFDKDINDLEILWWLTTVWVGYDFDCFKISSLKEGIVESVLISKNDMTKMLAIVICFVGLMHPFIWYIFESVQLRKEREIFCYYEDVINSEKPYGLVRGLRKFLYSSERNNSNENIRDQSKHTGDRENNESGGQSLSINADNPVNVANAIEVDIQNNTSPKQGNIADVPPGQPKSEPTSEILTEYVPFFRFSIVITLIICSMHLYKLTDMDNEMFKENGYFNFPQVYRFGIPEYYFIPPYICFIVSAIVYCISNALIYILYNESEDFIICIPIDLFCGKWIVKTKTIFPTMKEKDDLYSFRAGQKLIFRFTMIFSIRFWRFVFTNSMCGSSICCLSKDNWFTCIFYTIYKLVSVPLLITINVSLNIIFCTFPAFWFIVFMILRILGIGKPDTDSQKTDSQETDSQETDSQETDSQETYLLKVCKCFLYILYLLTLRQQVAFFIFIIRSCFYVIIVGFIGPERVWRIYIIIVASVTYFLSYVNGFINSYKVLLEVIFRESEVKFIDESMFNYIIDHCYAVKKRIFFVVVKTSLTIVFLVVTFLMLRETGKLDNSKYLNEFVSYLMILISPRIVSIFSQSSPNEDIQKHKEEINTLISVYNEKREIQKLKDLKNAGEIKKSNDEKKEIDVCWKKVKNICESGKGILNCGICDCWFKVLKAVFCQWHLTIDQNEILSLDGKVTEVGRCSSCCPHSSYEELNRKPDHDRRRSSVIEV